MPRGRKPKSLTTGQLWRTGDIISTVKFSSAEALDTVRKEPFGDGKIIWAGNMTGLRFYPETENSGYMEVGLTKLKIVTDNNLRGRYLYDKDFGDRSWQSIGDNQLERSMKAGAYSLRHAVTLNPDGLDGLRFDTTLGNAGKLTALASIKVFYRLSSQYRGAYTLKEVVGDGCDVDTSFPEDINNPLAEEIIAPGEAMTVGAVILRNTTA